MKLSNVRVVDLTQFLPGPFLAMTMADHGAEVIKIEPQSGDPTRDIGPMQCGHTVYFRNVNRGKKCVAANLKDPQQRDEVFRLMAVADVVIESFRPGVIERLGLDYARLAKVAPHIVYCSISAFGQCGPLKQRAAHDLSIQAMTGALSLTQGVGRPPAIPAVPAADMAVSLMALSGILMALMRARDTGEGDYIDAAMHDSLLAWLIHATGPVFAEQRSINADSDRTLGGAAFYNLYVTLDNRWLSLGGSEPKFATNLLNALGRPELVELCQLPAGAQQQPVREFLMQTFRTKTLNEWLAWLEGKDVCYAGVNTLVEAFQSENVASRNMHIKGQDGADHIGVPIKFMKEPARPRFEVESLSTNLAALNWSGTAAE